MIHLVWAGQQLQRMRSTAYTLVMCYECVNKGHHLGVFSKTIGVNINVDHLQNYLLRGFIHRYMISSFSVCIFDFLDNIQRSDLHSFKQVTSSNIFVTR